MTFDVDGRHVEWCETARNVLRLWHVHFGVVVQIVQGLIEPQTATVGTPILIIVKQASPEASNSLNGKYAL